jgi:hypothetical protein
MPTLDTTYTPSSVATTTPTAGEAGYGADPLSALMAKIVMAKMNRQRGDGSVGITTSGTSLAQDRAESNAYQDRNDARRRAMLAEEAQKKAANVHPITQQYYGLSGNPVYSWDIPGMRSSFESGGK